jgi:D-3-phosphoglycerate dehydrogenase/(S)-sulfolactate dehydrogenase
MSKPRVLITTYYLHPEHEVIQHLRKAGLEPVFSPWRGGRTEEQMIDVLQGIDGAIASSDPFSARVIGAADRLKVIARTGAGYDTVDVKAATARKIAVCTTPGANRHAVAEWAITLMLVLARKALDNLAEIRKGGWTRHEGVDMTGKTLGIIGLGTIGREVAQRMRAFEMRILACDPVQNQQFAEEHGITYVPLEQLLRESDFVTIHSFMSAENKHMINAERLVWMKPTAYLVNTGRGGIIDGKALYQALQEKRIAGAGLDVFEEEPLPADSPLRELDNLLMSPHSAGATAETRMLSPFMAADDVIRVLRGERALYALNPEIYQSCDENSPPRMTSTPPGGGVAR